jgi:hypothetical protein
MMFNAEQLRGLDEKAAPSFSKQLSGKRIAGRRNRILVFGRSKVCVFVESREFETACHLPVV